MTKDFIEIKEARIHNLKNISLRIPKNKLVVICGISGSGKSSLAFDTIYQEGQRRYLESLSSYARQFLGGIKKPDVGKIENLSPTLAINQKTVSANPRSTVGTVTEIYDYLRLLFARIGKPYCPNCNIPISATTPQKIVEEIFKLPPGAKIKILGPAISGKKGEHKATLEEIEKSGYFEVRIDNIHYSITEARTLRLDKNKRHNIEVVVGEIEIPKNQTIIDKNKKELQAKKTKQRKIKKLLKEQKAEALDFVKKALQIGNGILICEIQSKKKTYDKQFSSLFACPKCGFSLPKIEPRLFSFNSPYGACPECQGLGKKPTVDPNLILNYDLSINEGGIIIWDRLSRFSRRAIKVPWQKWQIDNLAYELGFSLDTPLKNLSKKNLDYILYGGESFEGIIPLIERIYYETESEYIRKEISKYIVEKPCPLCKETRLKKEALAVKIENKNIAQIANLSVSESITFFKKLIKKLTGTDKKIATPIIKELLRRYEFLKNVGLDYITQNREVKSLSVGENQRIRLACQLGSGLSGVVYVLDEPTVGLHQRDIQRLIDSLKQLRDMKNTVIVVEHDFRVLRQADWIIEIGPGAGKHGGRIVFEGTFDELKKSKTITGKYISGKLKVTSGSPKKEVSKDFLILRGASQFNLKNVDLKIPLGNLICIVGVSGSGKSTLIIETLAKILTSSLHYARVIPGKYKAIEGIEKISKAVVVDQSPIGRTPRSNPATYTGVFGPIREVFAHTREAKIRGFSPSHFSFNTPAGRCQACQGEGYKKIEMYFLPDIYVECELCKGKRYAPEILEVKYQGKSIADVLEMSVDEAERFFRHIYPIQQKLQLLKDIGLGYIKLGQPAPTLSGGEAQRIKLAKELSSKVRQNTIYILDEPTVGLHFEDIKKLLKIFRRLQEKGATIIVIEHNPDVIKEADWIIELGPEGGKKGGRIIFEGTLQKLKKSKTWTARYLD